MMENRLFRIRGRAIEAKGIKVRHTDSQDLVLEAGDTIHTEIVIEDGQLSYKIQKNDDEPIAESEGIFFSVDYDVVVEESGTYTVTVTGEKTKGSVKFIVESAE